MASAAGVRGLSVQAAFPFHRPQCLKKSAGRNGFSRVSACPRFPSIVVGNMGEPEAAPVAAEGRCGRDCSHHQARKQRTHRNQGQTQPCRAWSRDPLPLVRPHLLEFLAPPKIAGPNTPSMSLWWSFISKPQKLPSVSAQLGLSPLLSVMWYALRSQEEAGRLPRASAVREPVLSRPQLHSQGQGDLLHPFFRWGNGVLKGCFCYCCSNLS